MSTTITADMDLKWLIEEGAEFKGTTESILLPDGTVAYTGGMTLDEYERDRDKKFKILSNSELDALTSTFCDGMVTDPVKISKTRWWEMLEILPPCRWHMAGTWECFHISERLYGNLVSWFGTRRLGGVEVFYEFTDRDNLELEDLRDKLNKAAAD